MSRIGKRIIIMQENNEATFINNVFKVKGPHGENSRELSRDFNVLINNCEITVVPINKSNKKYNIMYGTINSHIYNMVNGVNKPFEKTLVIVGVGYRARIEGNHILLKLGFSHDIKIEIPSEINVKIDKQIKIFISSCNKEKLGLFAAKIRAYKPPEPYLGKGIAYKDEKIRRKEGKASSKGK